MRRVHTCVLSSLGLSVANNLLTNQVEVGVLDAGLVQEFTPLLRLLLVVLVALFGI